MFPHPERSTTSTVVTPTHPERSHVVHTHYTSLVYSHSIRLPLATRDTNLGSSKTAQGVCGGEGRVHRNNLQDIPMLNDFARHRHALYRHALLARRVRRSCRHSGVGVGSGRAPAGTHPTQTRFAGCVSPGLLAAVLQCCVCSAACLALLAAACRLWQADVGAAGQTGLKE
ncbi:hypothetical protein E2C01_092405 [Portunus trituberculatus]|uniref:Uncharacterized protein n=1 Tax=Portunus trituberculatus TaxID=210409 RepID=A0A5B7JLW0_PORTR|nr:hypothetical protein [Portunus trituberculatus]